MPYSHAHPPILYSPFSTSRSATESPRFIPQPQILATKLVPLEWSANRRSKPRAVDASGTNAAPNAAPIAPNLRSQPAKPIIKEVIREVYAEPTTMMGVPAPFDDRIRHVVNFMLEHVSSRNVEVEAKLGLLVEREQNVRAVSLVPVTCETPISTESNRDTRFESNVGEENFYRIIQRLNDRVAQSSHLAQGALQCTSLTEVDIYWPGRIRETKRKTTGPDGAEVWKTVKTESKKRLGDLNVLCPGRWCDLRYSASVEEPCSLPTSGKPTMQRVKNRLSYRYEAVSIDLTTVEMESERGTERTFEVEVEIVPEANLVDEVVKYRNGDARSRLFEQATLLVNTVRTLLEM